MSTFAIDADDVRVERKACTLILSFDAYDGDVANLLTVKQLIEHFGHEAFLDEIGEKESADYFGWDLTNERD